MKTITEIHDYWKNPNDMNNSPEGYLDNEKTLLRSKYLHKIISNHFNTDAKILELGSNVGRNLNYLYERGFKNLTGVEISANAVRLMMENYPECVNNISVILNSIESTIRSLRFPRKNQFDITFTMAVLEHIHSEAEWIFDEMIRISKNILTIEDESSSTWRHFPRDYKDIFGDKMKQIKVQRCGSFNGLSKRFVMRLFTKE